MKENKIIILFGIVILFMFCKNDKKNIYDKYSNSLVKTITNYSITIIGKWRMINYSDGENIYYFNQGASLSFSFNHILQINSSEICTWFLNDNVLTLSYPSNTINKSFKEDSFFVYAEKQNATYQIYLNTPNGRSTYLLSKE